MASAQPTPTNQPEPSSPQQSTAEPIVDPTAQSSVRPTAGEPAADNPATEPETPPATLLQKIALALKADAKAVTDTQPAQPPQAKGLAKELAKEEEKAFGEDDQTKTAELIAQAEAASKHADTQDKQSQTRLREQLAGRVFTFMERWCAFVAIIFWMYFSTKKGDIPSEVMIALLTTTTVSVIGLVGFVVQGLFRARAAAPEGKES
ncbi:MULTISPECIES: hypothetical protein [Aeromonas]|uniref:hypothetical protein n=1 Tax=Aeromonas TaxID=642 RepID=UPI0020B1C865|nr:hypothetical protein [Aeromonas hydrophila]MCP3323748.1 hypothetical protein [Aeromonas hydrophila]